jgi:hypothetical protein
LGERQLDKLEVAGSSPAAPIVVFSLHGRGFCFLRVGVGIGAPLKTLKEALAPR